MPLFFFTFTVKSLSVQAVPFPHFFFQLTPFLTRHTLGRSKKEILTKKRKPDNNLFPIIKIRNTISYHLLLGLSFQLLFLISARRSNLLLPVEIWLFLQSPKMEMDGPSGLAPLAQLVPPRCSFSNRGSHPERVMDVARLFASVSCVVVAHIAFASWSYTDHPPTNSPTSSCNPPGCSLPFHPSISLCSSDLLCAVFLFIVNEKICRYDTIR